METTLQQTALNSLLENGAKPDNEMVADILQNDISQTLAAVLLWMQTAMDEEGLSSNRHLQLAETNLKSSIKQLVRLHYALVE